MLSGRFALGAWVGLAAATLLPAQFVRPNITNGVDFAQKLNAPVPLDDTFRDESGQTVPLRTYFGDKPVVLALVYFNCPSLCTLTLNEMTSNLRRVPQQAGRDYEVVVVSFDPKDTPQLATEKKANYAKQYNRGDFMAGWHFLTGTQESIDRLTSAVGFRYRWDAATHQFVHASGIMVATPEGRLSRYFFGVQYAPGDLRLSLVEAAKHNIGSPVDYALLYCFHYDESQGRYTLAILNILKLAAGVTLVCLVGLLYFLMKPDKKNKTKTQWKEAPHAS